MQTRGGYEPLARYYGTKALAYSALGATLYLETLTRDDEPRLRDAIERLWAWFGHELKWCIQSFNPQAVSTTLDDVPATSRAGCGFAGE